MPLPLLRLSGSPFDQGLQHGRALRERIVHNLKVYFHRFENEARLPRDEVLARAELYAKLLPEQNRSYAQGLKGIAEGCGAGYLELVALNVRYEILYHQFTANAIADYGNQEGCTSFALAPAGTVNGHVLMGQNWDWIPQVLGAVIHTTDADGTATLAFTEAGIFGGKIGLNSAGLGLAVNGLISTADDWSLLRRPFHVRCYEILRSPTLDAAVRVITGEERSCSTNFLIAQEPNGIVDVEAAPGRSATLYSSDDCLVHANHFVDPGAMGIEEPPTPRRLYSGRRHERLAQLLRDSRPLSVGAIQERLRDHQDFPNAICRHPDPELVPDQQSITVTSVVMDLHTRRLWLTDRQPCENPYQEVSL